jgi:peptidoglycan L-alanyl-D-glutamate endopeptidase CwlK
MSFAWGERSILRLDSCHPLLLSLMKRVIKRKDLPCDLTILCGHRNQKEQDAAFASGNSKLKWPRSKHNSVPSMAVDVAPMLGAYASWDWDLYNKVAPLVKDEWGKMEEEGLVPAGTKLSWGGDWAKFKDGPHWELG